MSEQSLEFVKQKTTSNLRKEKELPKEGFYLAFLKRLKKQQRKALRYLAKKHATTLIWLAQQKNDLKKAKSQAAQAVATGTVATAIFMATSTPIVATSLPNISSDQVIENAVSFQESAKKIQEILNKVGSRPKAVDETIIANLISNSTGVIIRPQLEGHRLNRTVGFIGAEQHLRRYPGDTLSAQLKTADEKAMFSQSGMAPHKGAYGYFANSKQELTEDLIQEEKYYLAVQTFLIPEWKTSWAKDKDWFKFRKMLVYNPESGKAVVAVIADAGPAKWTGKHYGGSPEVMHELGLADGSRKGEVVIMFVVDPENQVPLGPVQIKTQEVLERK